MDTSKLLKITQFTSQPRSRFSQILDQIQKTSFFEERLEIANDLYKLKQYKIMGLTPKKVSQLYQSLQQKAYDKGQKIQHEAWASHELKLFMWIAICYLGEQISNPQQIDFDVWSFFSEIFNFKSIKLMQYQVKLLVNSRGPSRRWQKQEETLIQQILVSNNNLLISNGKNIKWNEASLKLYFSSNLVYFRHPKQIREHWINHLNPQISKESWTLQEDANLLKNVIENGKKWALIAKNQGRRTQHMIKNRFHSLIRKEQNNFPNATNQMELLSLIRQKYEISKLGETTCTRIICLDSQLESFVDQPFDQYQKIKNEKGDHFKNLDVLMQELQNWKKTEWDQKSKEIQQLNSHLDNQPFQHFDNLFI